jgi:hypothetical protein
MDPTFVIVLPQSVKKRQKNTQLEMRNGYQMEMILLKLYKVYRRFIIQIQLITVRHRNSEESVHSKGLGIFIALKSIYLV